jgi:predicted metalloprotease with PDZ domain
VSHVRQGIIFASSHGRDRAASQEEPAMTPATTTRPAQRDPACPRAAAARRPARLAWSAWLAAASIGVSIAAAQVSAPPPAREVPPPQDVAYPGVITLEVDLTDLAHRVFDVRERLPVAGPGPLTLLYPRWLPGNHGPTGPIQSLAGLVVTVAGEPARRIEWQRDPLNMFAFHLDVPEGVRELELRFQFVSPATADQGRRTVTADLLGLQWEKALLYPAGHYARQVTMRPSIRLPAGWEFATAARVAARDGDRVQFEPLSLERLVDSPLFAGRHVRRFELDPDPRAPVHLNVFADRASQLEALPAQVEAHRRLVRESLRLFGSRHYRRYDFLLALSEDFGGIGLEHHESSENGVGPGYFIDWDGTATVRDLLPHEYVHSWNGKFRRPADLWTPGYDVAMRNSLLWVYEGMTEFWGTVLAARSGLWSEAYTRDALAHYAATFDQARAGRDWRNLQDTTHQPIMAYRVPLPFQSWQRSTDYYTEGVLLWLDVDTRLRELTRERRSLDDFARAFFGLRDGELGPLTYTFDDLVRALGEVAPHDWRGLLRERVEGHPAGAPLDGFARAGWKLVYRDTPSAFTRGADTEGKRASATFSLGLSVAREGGRIVEVVWGSPAFQAGLATGSSLVAVNGRAWQGDELAEALRAAQRDGQPIELLVRRDDRYSTVRIDYRGGPRYPHLERIPGTPDRLAELLRARTPAR